MFGSRRVTRGNKERKGPEVATSNLLLADEVAEVLFVDARAAPRCSLFRARHAKARWFERVC